MNRTTLTQEKASAAATSRRKATVTMREAVAPFHERMERMRQQRESDKAFRKMVYQGFESMTQADFEALSKDRDLTPEQRQAFARIAAK